MKQYVVEGEPGDSVRVWLTDGEVLELLTGGGYTIFSLECTFYQAVADIPLHILKRSDTIHHIEDSTRG